MKNLLYTIFGLTMTTFVFAVPANPNPVTFTQPDNSTFTGFVKGDEWQHWFETYDGYTFSENELNEWVYVRSFFSEKYELTNILVDDGPTPESILSIPKHIKPDRNAPAPLENIPDLQSITRTNYNIPMLLIEFPDLLANIDVSNFDDMMNMENYESSQGVTGSFNDYYLEVSYDAFDPATYVTGWFMAAESYLVYGDSAPNGYNKVRELIRDAVNEACADGMDWSNYDNDGDGYVDALNIVHAGVGAEEGNTSYIWSHSWNLGSYATSCDGVIINNYVIQPERTNMMGGGMVHIGVFAHEFGHALGIPDLYDTDYSSSGIGHWGLMSGGSWGGDGGSPWYPVHMSAWVKVALGWVDPITIDEPFITHEFENVEENPIIFKMDGIGSSNEYFLFENRQKVLYDQNLPHYGLLIWHIDESQWGNTDDWHRKVDLEQADGFYHLNTNGNSGDPGDPYPGYSNNNIFAFHTEPNSVFYDGDPSGISVIDIDAYDGLITATFRNIPTLSISESDVQEVIGDNDGVINPGENGIIEVQLYNPSFDPVINLMGIPTSNDQYITVNTYEVSFPDIGPLGYSTMNEPIEISIAPDTPLGEHSIEIFITGDLEDDVFEQTIHLIFDVTILQAGFPLDIGIEVVSSPLHVENGIVFCDNNGFIHMIDYTGNALWESPFNAGDEIWGAPAAADIDNDNEIEIIVTSKSKMMFILNIDGSLQASFDAGQFLTSTPAIGNIDSDEELEIVFGSMSNSGKVFAIDHDGSLVDGFPIQINEKIWVGAALADLNDNGIDDIIVVTDSGNLHVFYDDGLNFQIQSSSNIRSAPSVLSLNNGADKFIFFGNDDGNFYSVDSNGYIRFILETGEMIRSTPSLIEYNENSYIFFTTENNTIYALDFNGNYLPGWPINTGYELKSSCTFSDLDSNGIPEIIVAARNGNILVYEMNGNPMNYFPLDLERTIENTPIIIDIDNDEDLEIITGDAYGLSVIDIKETGTITSWNLHRGNLTRNGVLIANDTDICNDPESGDLNCDSSLDILDIVLLVNIVLDEILPSGYEYWASDLNEDGILDILDIILLINLIIDS